MKGKLFLIHWKAAEAEELAKPLREDGWEVTCEAQDGARAGKLIKTNPPDVVVIYLTRLPSHGRETGQGLRALKATRHLPIIFVDGIDEALAKTKAKVPDAVYTTAAELPNVLAGFAKG
jgi:DNA-binding response OmpR family regulator